MSPARIIAFDVLDAVERGGYASDLLQARTAGLEARDAALAHELVFGVLRRQAQLDFLIAHFSGRPAQRLDPEVRRALRLGIHQLRNLDRIPPHAAVAESVELMKRGRKRSAAGLVNAVLRKVHREPVEWPDRATGLSMPVWLMERWDHHYGAEAAEAVARAALLEPGDWTNDATGRRQDVGSQSIVPLLEIRPGQRLLDLCAAPGNKTAQAIAAGARVTACDLHWKRLRALDGLNCQRVVLDGTLSLPFHIRFDRILVDAPCSGTGTLARNPEIKWRLEPAKLAELHAIQVRLLAHALERLAPGGRLVYSTCSLEPEENEQVLAEVLGGLARRLVRRLPGREPGDGFFAAVIPSDKSADG
jgi:16S rRNA (cytosine967-C5)-methyltransferase